MSGGPKIASPKMNAAKIKPSAARRTGVLWMCMPISGSASTFIPASLTARVFGGEGVMRRIVGGLIGIGWMRGDKIDHNSRETVERQILRQGKAAGVVCARPRLCDHGVEFG